MEFHACSFITITHIHTAQWQQIQFSLIKENMPHKSVIQMMDFSKNRGIIYQEVKATFLSNSQITMHPIVNYYRKRDKPGIV